MYRLRSPAGRRPRGLVAIELLAAVVAVAAAIFLIIPALLSSREAARLGRCANNLRQIALAAQAYQAAHGCLPAGSYGVSTHPRNFSVFARLLPQLGETTLYNSINMSLAHVDVENLTVGASGIDALFCPSDPEAGRVSRAHYSGNPNSPSSVPPGDWTQRLCSYAGNAGTWNLDIDPTSSNHAARLACMNGTIYGSSAVTPADISDGVTHTFLFAERAHSVLGVPTIATWLDSWTGVALDEHHFWQSGETVDALFETWSPPNQHKLSIRPAKPDHARFLASNASSFHAPGGAHFAFCDGSVRFLLESIDSWKPSNTGVPKGLTYDRDAGTWSWNKGMKLRIYQALSTRNSGEAIDPGF